MKVCSVDICSSLASIHCKMISVSRPVEMKVKAKEKHN